MFGKSSSNAITIALSVHVEKCQQLCRKIYQGQVRLVPIWSIHNILSKKHIHLSFSKLNKLRHYCTLVASKIEKDESFEFIFMFDCCINSHLSNQITRSAWIDKTPYCHNWPNRSWEIFPCQCFNRRGPKMYKLYISGKFKL